jgi:hypothetical protein
VGSVDDVVDRAQAEIYDFTAHHAFRSHGGSPDWERMAARVGELAEAPLYLDERWHRGHKSDSRPV